MLILFFPAGCLRSSDFLKYWGCWDPGQLRSEQQEQKKCENGLEYFPTGGVLLLGVWDFVRIDRKKRRRRPEKKNDIPVKKNASSPRRNTQFQCTYFQIVREPSMAYAEGDFVTAALGMFAHRIRRNQKFQD